MILPASMWIGPLMVDKKKRIKERVHQPFKSTQTWKLNCVKLYSGEWESGGRVQGSHNSLFYFQTHTFSMTATGGNGCSLCALQSMPHHQSQLGLEWKTVGKSLTSTVSYSLCSIVCLWQLDCIGHTGTVLRFKADFSEGLLLCDASGALHPVCTTDTILINQWDVNMTVRISSSSVLQTWLGERKGNFWCM